MLSIEDVGDGAAMLCPEWQYWYYSFDGNWAQGEMTGSIRDGSGDQVFALFDKHGCFNKEFSHGSSIIRY